MSDKMHFAMCNINAKLLRKQRHEILKGPGMCALTAIYNAYPKLFYNDYTRCEQMYLRMSNANEDAMDMGLVMEKINNAFGYEVLSGWQLDGVTKNYEGKRVNIDFLKRCIKSAIDNNLSACLAIHTKLPNRHTGHMITIVGYDKKYYYIYDNSTTNFVVDFLTLLKPFKNIQLDYQQLFDELMEKKQFLSHKDGFLGIDKNLIYALFPFIAVIVPNRENLKRAYQHMETTDTMITFNNSNLSRITAGNNKYRFANNFSSLIEKLQSINFAKDLSL